MLNNSVLFDFLDPRGDETISFRLKFSPYPAPGDNFVGKYVLNGSDYYVILWV